MQQRVARPAAAEESIDLVIANAENAAGGSGLTPKIYEQLIAAGVDCITMGDHIYRRREIDPVLEREPEHRQAGELPARRPAATGPSSRAANGVRVAVFSLLGRLFMRPVDCPWTRADEVLAGDPRRRPRPHCSISTPKRPATNS